jgi:hypothetical protein
MSEVSSFFQHVIHPRTRERLAGAAAAPPKVNDQRVGLNGRIGLFITTIVGTMWAAYVFGVLAFLSLPSALETGETLVIVAWIAQTFLQLVLLPIIIVGQNLQARATDRRAEETYRDAKAMLHERLQIQAHFSAQGRAVQGQLAGIKALLQDRAPGAGA